MNDALEYVRQQCILFKKYEHKWKKNPPKGKKYVGFRFKPFKEYVNGWVSMGYRAIPVYEKKKK